MHGRLFACLACLVTLLAGCTGPSMSDTDTDASPATVSGPGQPAPAGAQPDGPATPDRGQGPGSALGAPSRIRFFATDHVLEAGPADPLCEDGSHRYEASLDPSSGIEIAFSCGASFTLVADAPFRLSGFANVSFEVVCTVDHVSALLEASATLMDGEDVLGTASKETAVRHCAAGTTVPVKLEVPTQAWAVADSEALILHIGGLWREAALDPGLVARFSGPLFEAGLEGDLAPRHLQVVQDGAVTGVRAATWSVGVAASTNGWLLRTQEGVDFSGGLFNLTFEPRSAAILAVRVFWAKEEVRTEDDYGFLVREDIMAPGGTFQIPAFSIPGAGYVIATVQPMNPSGVALAQPVRLGLALDYSESADLSPWPIYSTFAEEPCPPMC